MAMLLAMTFKGVLSAYAIQAILEMAFLAMVSFNKYRYFNITTTTDIDECSTGGVCDDNAECVDTAGSYECTCSSGYTGDGHTCLDIDECLSDPCDENATCTNNIGSFSCHCHTGFVENGSVCEGRHINLFLSTLIFLLSIDINECSQEHNNCSVNSTCTNTVGSYQCSCFPGYHDEGMGYSCTGQ